MDTTQDATSAARASISAMIDAIIAGNGHTVMASVLVDMPEAMVRELLMRQLIDVAAGVVVVATERAR